MTQLDAHLIICFRGEPKTEVGKDGKPKVLGIQPVWGSAIPFKLDFHLHMKDKDKPGVYEPWFRGLQHEREIFPGGKVDAETVKRLLASYAGDAPVTGRSAEPPAQNAALDPDDPLHDLKLSISECSNVTDLKTLGYEISLMSIAHQNELRPIYKSKLDQLKGK